MSTLEQVKHAIEVRPTKPFTDQKPGTSGLRKPTKTFKENQYFENFIQAYFDDLAERNKDKSPTLIVGGDGRHFVREGTRIIIQMAAANNIKKLIVARDAIMSTPSVSCVIRKYGTDGGIVLTASHNPGGINNDYGVKFNIANGGPAPEAVTNSVYDKTRKLTNIRLCPTLINIDLLTLGKHSYEIEGRSIPFEIEIIDSVDDYVQLMKSIFDFDKIRNLLNGDKGNFPIMINALSGVMGPYVLRIFHEELNAKEVVTVKNCENLEDFGGHHPDPNLTYAHELVEDMQNGNYEFGAAFDGDGDRNMILGKGGFFVTPCDSLAVLAANLDVIPYFQKHGVFGYARSMPTSGAVDRVAEKSQKLIYEVPTGWKFFGNLMDSKLISICGEESFGTGSDHIREKDGMWAVLSWLSVLANIDRSVEKILQTHWHTYGRNFFTRYDYEEINGDGPFSMMKRLEDMCTSKELINKTFNTNYGNKQYTVKIMDDFSYTDPVDGSYTEKQGIRVIFTDGSRLVFRLSGTGARGATVRLYVDSYENDPVTYTKDAQEMLKPLISLALEIAQLKEFTGRDKPTVIT
ncbi:unnamed protein product [Rotaria magnacalcarata]|uniref:phosphoglucomutase (alpha-D-glucose-1,6-bisphosphate-dependent) n=3 Tax=Rotaria magnacalcarata TaxID=392030 RepID=A0A815WZK8_9BILA|nr:unnamed protein product [Rotaria magnacalcarata]CAF1552579.1 unnamed protein product [Rotaria magnacalcarata]CAF2046717.1 unnamed protein product [Rotaria magnacalcarata]CAF2047263.1 unnamed protein product [Rotaria magnacalcarata]CAF3949562.1 unnamed protein product [Rotaria magnacalcarata]